MTATIYTLDNRDRRLESIARMIHYMRAEARDLNLPMIDDTLSVVEALVDDVQTGYIPRPEPRPLCRSEGS